MKTPHGGGGVVAFDCRKLAEVYAFPQSKATDGDGTDGTGPMGRERRLAANTGSIHHRGTAEAPQRMTGYGDDGVSLRVVDGR